jgi:3-oxoacyl-(acyl-carrier-protein) synthase
MGHLEGSSGIVAVIKTALMLERGFVLPNCNYQKTNEEIPMEQWNMKVRNYEDIFCYFICSSRTGSEKAAALAPG